MTEIKTAEPFFSSTSGQVPQVHATLDGERTLCGRAIGEFWTVTDRFSLDRYLARRPKRVCTKCRQKVQA